MQVVVVQCRCRYLMAKAIVIAIAIANKVAILYHGKFSQMIIIIIDRRFALVVFWCLKLFLLMSAIRAASSNGNNTHKEYHASDPSVNSKLQAAITTTTTTRSADSNQTYPLAVASVRFAINFGLSHKKTREKDRQAISQWNLEQNFASCSNVFPRRPLGSDLEPTIQQSIELHHPRHWIFLIHNKRSFCICLMLLLLMFCYNFHCLSNVDHN